MENVGPLNIDESKRGGVSAHQFVQDIMSQTGQYCRGHRHGSRQIPNTSPSSNLNMFSIEQYHIEGAR